MIALVLGGAPAVWREAAEAQALLNRRHVVVAANLAGIHYSGRLDGWASLHTDRLAGWLGERAGNRDCRLFVAGRHRSLPTADIIAERWPGSSGLYALQVALLEMGATGAILCGVPMEQQAGHFSDPGPWATTADYRQAFVAALPEIGARTRSMGGWTADLFGTPSAVWLDAIDTAKSLGASSPQQRTRTDMHKVTNTSDATVRFKHTTAEGELDTASLAPGESGEFDINPAQAAFATDELKIKAIGPDTDKPAKAEPKTPPEGA